MCVLTPLLMYDYDVQLRSYVRTALSRAPSDPAAFSMSLLHAMESGEKGWWKSGGKLLQGLTSLGSKAVDMVKKNVVG